MDRRKFLWSVGAAGTASAAAGSFAIRESQASARASGLLKAATGNAGSRASVVRSANALNGALLLGYLPGSAGMLANAATELRMENSARGVRWTRWDQGAAQLSRNSLFKRSTTVQLSIGALQRAAVHRSPLQSLEIVAHFAIDEAPYFAEFGAWSYRGDRGATKQSTTQPLTFTVEVPDRVALEVNYSVNPLTTAAGTSNTGRLYLPVGRDGRAGLTTGLYVLAAASAETGMTPDLGAWMFGGIHVPLADSSGRGPNFDYVMLAIRPVAL